MVLPDARRSLRRRLMYWRGVALGAGLSITFQQLASRADGFNAPRLVAQPWARARLERAVGVERITGWERPCSAATRVAGRSGVSGAAAVAVAATAKAAASSSPSSAGRRGRTLSCATAAAGATATTTAATATRLNAHAENAADAAGTPRLNINGYQMDEGWMGNTWAVGGRGGGGGVVSGTREDVEEPLVVAQGEEIAEDTEESMEAAAKRSVPLKVMVFVDGTWLYYSFFGRGERCHVSAKLGPGWNYEYKVKWEMLPVIISRALHAQLAKNNQPSRLVEVVRTVVFSSARSDTDKDSARMQMFNAMREQNFEVHMATTMGVQEKCIDIALAVEMMHYATIPDTYDVGVLVTGDKDFMPAMSRTRQKGRRVCLCSMRNSCNQDLLRDDAHVMDFAPVWINEHIDDMMEYMPPSGRTGNRAQAKVPPEVLCEVIIKLMEQMGGSIRSRDLGRALSTISVLENGTKALAVIKESWGSLTKFLVEHNDVFQVGTPQPDPQDPEIMQFTISMVERQNSMKSVKLGEVMNDSASGDVAYDGGDDDDDVEESEWGGDEERETEASLSLEKVPQLKQRLRDRGLPVSGVKAALVERLLLAMESERPSPPPPPRYPSAATQDGLTSEVGTAGGGGAPKGWAEAAAAAAVAGALSRVRDARGGGVGTGGGGGRQTAEARAAADEQEEEAKNRRVSGHEALVAMVGGILDSFEAPDGMVSSRVVGRELARMPSPDPSSQTALMCLKSRWPSLMAFLKACSSEFTVTDIGHEKEFGVVRRGKGGGGGGLGGSLAGGGGGGGGGLGAANAGGVVEERNHAGWSHPTVGAAANGARRHSSSGRFGG